MILFSQRFLYALLMLFLLCSTSSCSIAYKKLGGSFPEAPKTAFKTPAEGGLSTTARKLVCEAFKGFDGESKTMGDIHLHMFGFGKPERQHYIDTAVLPHCQRLNCLLPHQRPSINIDEFVSHYPSILKRLLVGGTFLASTAVKDKAKFDQQYIERLAHLIAFYDAPGQPINEIGKKSVYGTRFHIIAMDGIYDSEHPGKAHDAYQGQPHPGTLMYVPNEYVVKLSECLNKEIIRLNPSSRNKVVPVGSINPLRHVGIRSDVSKPPVRLMMRDKDELKRQIKYLVKNNVKAIKWRAATMELDPAQVDCWFYEKLAQEGIAILSHTGASKGVPMPKTVDRWAEPFQMRSAIEHGVTVVLLHLGRGDLDGEGPSVDQSLSYMAQAQCLIEENKGRVFGEISALPYDDTHTLFPAFLRSQTDERGKFLINGSDYPAVSMRFLGRSALRKLQQDGYLTKEQRRALKEVYDLNPLLFDFVLKRTLKIPGATIKDSSFKLPHSIFLNPDFLKD